MKKVENGLIYLNLYAEAYYSGAEYDETIFITPQDYLKYFCNGVDLTKPVEIPAEMELAFEDDKFTFTNEEVKKAYQLAKVNWHEKSVYVGELDGKHSEVEGEVYVDFFDEEAIRKQYNKSVSNDDILISRLLRDNGFNDYSENKRIIREIQKNVDELVKTIGEYVEVTVRIPKSKVAELKAFADKLNK